VIAARIICVCPPFGLVITADPGPWQAAKDENLTIRRQNDVVAAIREAVVT